MSGQRLSQSTSNCSLDLGGGKGFIGQRLVQLLRERGFQHVWVVSRKSDGKSNTLTWVDLLRSVCVPGVRLVFFRQDDIRRGGMTSTVKPIKAIVNLAGAPLLSFQRWTDAYRNEVIQSRVETTKALASFIQDLKEEKPEVFISMSGVGEFD